jgi:hypothetical protein
LLTGFIHTDLEVLNRTDSENDIILEIHHIRNYEEFSCIENSLKCYNENEDCEEAIVEQIAAKRRKTLEDQETDEGDTTECEQANK